MAPDSVEILREGFEDFRRTHEPVAGLFAPDFVWDMSTFTGWPEKQAYHGLEGVAEFFDNWIGSFMTGTSRSRRSSRPGMARWWSRCVSTEPRS